MLRAYATSLVASILQILHIPLISVYALEIGLSPYEIGLIGGVSALMYALLAPFTGFISNRVGERRAITLSLAGLGFSYSLLNFARDFWSLIAVVVLSLAAYATFWPSMESLISHGGGSVSAFSTAWSSGSILGSLLVSPLLPIPKAGVFTGISASFASLAVFSLTFISKATVNRGPDLKDVCRGIVGAPKAWLWAFSYAASQGAVYTFYPVIVEVEGMPIWYVSLCFLSLMCARTIMFSFRDRLPRPLRSSYHLGPLLAFGVLLPFFRDALGVLLSSALLGLLAGALYGEALSIAFSSNPEKRGIYTGLFESFIGFGYAAGPVVAGIASTASLTASIPVAMVLSLATTYLPLLTYSGPPTER